MNHFIFSSAEYKGSNFSLSLLMLVFICFSDYRHPDEHEVNLILVPSRVVSVVWYIFLCVCRGHIFWLFFSFAHFVTFGWKLYTADNITTQNTNCHPLDCCFIWSFVDLLNNLAELILPMLFLPQFAASGIHVQISSPWFYLLAWLLGVCPWSA